MSFTKNLDQLSSFHFLYSRWSSIEKTALQLILELGVGSRVGGGPLSFYNRIWNKNEGWNKY